MNKNQHESKNVVLISNKLWAQMKTKLTFSR